MQIAPFRNGADNPDPGEHADRKNGTRVATSKGGGEELRIRKSEPLKSLA
jgi:hypothetical protein